MNKELWKKVCDDEGLAPDHWLREGPRESGPVKNCPCAYCDLTRKYEQLERELFEASIVELLYRSSNPTSEKM